MMSINAEEKLTAAELLKVVLPAARMTPEGQEQNLSVQQIMELYLKCAEIVQDVGKKKVEAVVQQMNV
jgi:hypothetical protein